MPRLTYALRIEYPEEIDADTLAEIEAEAESHDETLAAKIARWIGGDVDDAESHLSAVLPVGWCAAIDADD
jgi:hypothetical protein